MRDEVHIDISPNMFMIVLKVVFQIKFYKYVPWLQPNIYLTQKLQN
jgi:hypothetical protein